MFFFQDEHKTDEVKPVEPGSENAGEAATSTAAPEGEQSGQPNGESSPSPAGELPKVEPENEEPPSDAQPEATSPSSANAGKNNSKIGMKGVT